MAELGCGSAAKTSILLNALLARDGPDRTRFAGIDVSGSFLAAAKESLLASCAGLRAANVDLVCAEYIEGAPLHLAQLARFWLSSGIRCHCSLPMVRRRTPSAREMLVPALLCRSCN